MLLYGAEVWTDTAALGVFERKVLRKIFGPVRVGDDYHIRTNRELYELFNDMDVAKRINIQRFRWLGDVVRMDEDAHSRQVFDAVVGDHRRQRGPRKRGPEFARCDQLGEAAESSFKAGRNPIIGLLWPHK